LTGLYANQDHLRAAYGNVPGVIYNYVETIFSDVQNIQKTGKKMMEINVIPYHNYPETMIPLVHHHYSKKSKFFSSENITHYVRLIMFGCYNVDTMNIIYDWEIHKGHLEVFDKYGFRYIFDISGFIALK
jgi:hypothetical protein